MEPLREDRYITFAKHSFSSAELFTEAAPCVLNTEIRRLSVDEWFLFVLVEKDSRLKAI